MVTDRYGIILSPGECSDRELRALCTRIKEYAGGTLHAGSDPYLKEAAARGLLREPYTRW